MGLGTRDDADTDEGDEEFDSRRSRSGPDAPESSGMGSGLTSNRISKSGVDRTDSTGMGSSLVGDRSSGSSPAGPSQTAKGLENPEDHFGMDVPNEGVLQRLRANERMHGSRVQGWVDEGMPTDIMGNTRDMRAFRERQADRPAEVPTDIERQNAHSVQRSEKAAADTSLAGDTGVPDSVRSVVSSGGQSLDGDIKTSMESRMGASFDDVQIHAGPQAAAACDDIDARAFTVGNHVAFNHGEYDPGSPEGQHVIAHELAHVRQQTGGAVSMLPQEDGLQIDPDPAAEREAEQTAQRVMEGGELGIQRMADTDVHVQRKPKRRDRAPPGEIAMGPVAGRGRGDPAAPGPADPAAAPGPADPAAAPGPADPAAAPGPADPAAAPGLPGPIGAPLAVAAMAAVRMELEAAREQARGALEEVERLFQDSKPQGLEEADNAIHITGERRQRKSRKKIREYSNDNQVRSFKSLQEKQRRTRELINTIQGRLDAIEAGLAGATDPGRRRQLVEQRAHWRGRRAARETEAASLGQQADRVGAAGGEDKFNSLQQARLKLNNAENAVQRADQWRNEIRESHFDNLARQRTELRQLLSRPQPPNDLTSLRRERDIFRRRNYLNERQRARNDHRRVQTNRRQMERLDLRTRPRDCITGRTSRVPPRLVLNAIAGLDTGASVYDVLALLFIGISSIPEVPTLEVGGYNNLANAVGGLGAAIGTISAWTGAAPTSDCECSARWGGTRMGMGLMGTVVTAAIAPAFNNTHDATLGNSSFTTSLLVSLVVSLLVGAGVGYATQFAGRPRYEHEEGDPEPQRELTNGQVQDLLRNLNLNTDIGPEEGLDPT